ncbi:MAG: DUF1592 domain-containing protein [Planctomycetota bacterium]
MLALGRANFALCCRLLVFQCALWHSDGADGSTAVEIYRQHCARCHGGSGEGVKDYYESRLYGDEDVDALTRRIAETMPEDDPDACVGDDARAVAQYIYDEFYSYEARLAKGLAAPPRVELSRMTIAQFRNSVADLIGAFTAPPPDGRPPGFARLPTKRISSDGTVEAAGLLGAYYQSEKMSKLDQLVLMRIDSRLDFDFGAGSPDGEIASDAFAIVWQGSIQTRSTGYYDFRIVSPNGVRLYLNTGAAQSRGKLRDDDSATIRARLIDGWVSSGESRALRGRVFLIGGRRYPIRVEFFKYQETSSAIRLEWKPPHEVWSVVDADSLSSAPASRTFIVDTPFPADDRSLGYERGSAVSKEWHTAVANAALATAEEVTRRLPQLANVAPDDPDRRAKLADFVTRFAARAYRRPLTDDERRLLGQTLFADTTDETAVRRAVLLVLTSPHFLYTDLSPAETTPTGYSIAARLAFSLWDSLPDQALLLAAEREQLTTREQIEQQAKRMMRDPRARLKVQGFFQHWLELEQRDVSKDRGLYPEFDEAIIADLRRSLELFVDRVVWSKASDYRQLLQADYLLLNDRLKTLYGPKQHLVSAGSSSSSTFEPVNNSKETRSGILTHPYLLSAFAYHDNTSPIHRGVFLTRNIVGRQLKPPPIAVAFQDNAFADDLTMREKVTELTSDQACLSCHEVINPLGFALENFDAVGRWRTQENNKAIDARSDYTSAEGETLTITGPSDIAEFALSSPIAQRAFVKVLVHHFAKQEPAAYSPDLLEELRTSFVQDEFHIRKLITQIAARTAAHPSNASGEPSP